MYNISVGDIEVAINGVGNQVSHNYQLCHIVAYNDIKMPKVWT